MTRKFKPVNQIVEEKLNDLSYILDRMGSLCKDGALKSVRDELEQ